MSCITPVDGVYVLPFAVTINTNCNTPPSFAFSVLELVQEGEALTVFGPNVVMTGPIEFQGPQVAFDVFGTAVVNGCVQEWSIEGTFLDELPHDRWSGSFSVDFTDGCSPNCASSSGVIQLAVRPAPDCNGNGVHDECDLTCGASGSGCDVPGCGALDDCNENCIPDDCDGLGGATFVTWVGGVNDRWSEAGNWCPPLVPDNDSEQTFDVLVAGGGDVTVDVSPTVASLVLTDDSVISVRAASGADQTLVVTEGLDNAGGTIEARDGRTATIRETVVTGGVFLTTQDSFIVLDDSVAVGVALNTVGTGHIQVVNDGTLIDPTVQVLEVPDGERGFVQGLVQMASGGVIEIEAQSAPTSLEPTGVSDGVRFAGAGTLRMIEDPSDATARAVLGGATVPLSIMDPGFTLTGVGRVDATSMTSDGSIVATPAGTRALNLLAFDLENNGEMVVADAAAMFALGDVHTTGTGSVLLDGAGELDILGTLLLTGGGTLGPVSAATAAAEITLGGLTLRETLGGLDRVPAASQATFSGSMSAVVFGDIEVAALCPAAAGGCTPPSTGQSGTSAVAGVDLVVRGGDPARGVGATYIMSDMSTLALSGSFSIEDGGALQMGDTSTAAVAGNGTVGLCEQGAAVSRPSPAGGCTPPSGAAGGCTPPSLSVAGDAAIGLGGDSALFGVANVDVAGSLAVAGDFDNQLTSPECFDFSGSLLFDGAGAVQAMEAAGLDVGPSADGLVNNFALGAVVLAENATVQVVDAFDNQADPLQVGPGCEAVYVGTLVLQDNSTLLCDCPVYFAELQNNGGELCDAASPIESCSLDCDGDADVDITDYEMFLSCVFGEPVGFCRGCFDCDADGWVGLADFASFQLAFTGTAP